MATANLDVLKPIYLKLIDLIRDHRIRELGKTGQTHIPATEIEALTPPGRLHRMIEALVADQILDTFVGKDEDEEKLYLVEGKKGAEMMIFDCRATAEQMLAYRHSLIIQGALGIQVEHVRGNYYELYRNGNDERIRLTDKEGALLSYILDRADQEIGRTELAEACELTEAKLSTALNTLRRKIRQLGFTKEEVERMIPRYQRGPMKFNLRT